MECIEPVKRSGVLATRNPLQWLSKPVSLNYPFLFGSFAFIGWVQFLYLGEIQYVAEHWKLWMYSLALTHSAIILILLALVEAAIQSRAPTCLQRAFVFFAPLAVAALYLDFILYRTFSLHIAGSIRLLCAEGFAQGATIIRETGLPPKILASWVAYGIVIAIIGGLIMAGAQRLTQARPIQMRHFHALGAIMALYALAAVLEFAMAHAPDGDRILREHRRVTPIYMGIAIRSPGYPIKAKFVSLDHPSSSPLANKTNHVPTIQSQRKDIFIIVIESLRPDYVSESISPHLADFRRSCLPFPDGVASGNATHISWYSLLTANYPLYFGISNRSKDANGSKTIRVLNELGYKSIVISASNLDYYHLDELIFGKDLHLASSFFDPRFARDLSWPELDKVVTSQLLENLKGPSGGRAFFIFYQSTHHGYYWPDDWQPQFHPCSDHFNYAGPTISHHSLNSITNRYKNSIQYIDSLIGKVISKLRDTSQFDDAIILVTGDHGEEFLECGRMTHANDLCWPQTRIPFYLKLPGRVSRCVTNTLPTHVNVFPTLFDYMSIKDAQLQGTSLLDEAAQKSIIMTVNQNGGEDPLSFCVQNKNYKAWLQFRYGANRISNENTFYLYRWTDSYDKPLEKLSAQEAAKCFLAVFSHCLNGPFTDLSL